MSNEQTESNGASPMAADIAAAERAIEVDEAIQTAAAMERETQARVVAMAFGGAAPAAAPPPPTVAEAITAATNEMNTYGLRLAQNRLNLLAFRAQAVDLEKQADADETVVRARILELQTQIAALQALATKGEQAAALHALASKGATP